MLEFKPFSTMSRRQTRGSGVEVDDNMLEEAPKTAQRTADLVANICSEMKDVKRKLEELEDVKRRLEVLERNIIMIIHHYSSS